MKHITLIMILIALALSLSAAANPKEKKMKILVLYSSQTGTTREIAEFMAQEIGKAGHQADVTHCSEAQNLKTYDAIIIGAPVYAGKWKAEAGTFVKNNADLLKVIPHAYFMVGTSFDGKASPAEMRAILAKERELCPPVSEGRFMGRLDYSRLNVFQRMICKMMKAPEGDFRDWKAISEWTRETVQLLGVRC